MNDLPNTPDPSDFVLCLQITVIEFVNKGRNWKDREVVHIWYTFQIIKPKKDYNAWFVMMQ